MSEPTLSPPVSPGPDEPTLIRAVSRWQIVGLSINDVVGSGIYLLPAATFVLLGPASVWAVLIAGLAVALLVLCYAQASSYFDQPGGSYLYVREAFGSFAGFEIGWMTWLTRVASAAALAHGLALAVAHFWPGAAQGVGRYAIVVGSLVFLVAINVIGVRSAARTGVILVIAKLLPLLAFVGIGLFYIDPSRAFAIGLPPADFSTLGEAALLLLFAYAGFENIPAAAGEFKQPRRDLPFALVTMIVVCTLLYVSVQIVAQGLLPDLGASQTPLADAAQIFGGSGMALLLTVGGAISILGTSSNTMMLGPRYVYALSADGYGPKFLSNVHPRFRTPAAAVIVQGAFALLLAATGSFVQLALLSAVTRLVTYIGAASSLLVLQDRYRDRPGAMRLPGGKLIPMLALVLSVCLVASAGLANLIASVVAMMVGAVVYRFWRRDAA